MTETFVYNYINKSAEVGEAAVVAFQVIHKEQFPLPAGVVVHQIDEDPALARKHLSKIHWVYIRRIFGRRIWYRQMKKIIKEFRPDVVHCHFGVTGVYFTDFLEREKEKVPFITHFYGYDASELPLRDPVYAEGLKRLWKKSAWILAEGPAMGKRLEALGAPAERIRISPIIIDGRKYPQKNTQSYTLSDPAIALLIGRFVEKKGFHLFLEAVGKIISQLPNLKIVMIGTGPMMEQYQTIIDHYQMQALVSFEGMKTLSECRDYLMQADVLAQPSVTAANGDSEGGAPTILIESQMMGIPVIASTHADIPFVMGYPDFLAKEGSVDDLARVIAAFFENRSIEEKIRLGRKKAAEQHDMNISHAYPDMLLEFSR